MLTVNDIVNSMKIKQQKPDEDEMRRLPYKHAFIYGRLSSPRQVKNHHESIRAIALLVDLAIKDGYNSKITAVAVEKWLNDIRKGKAEAGVWSDGQVTVELRDLGLSGRLNDDRRPGLAHLKQTIRDDQTGCVYLTEGVSRLSRDEDAITPPTLLKLFREHDCRIRTRRRILNPCIQRDRDILEEEFRDARKEGHTMDIRMHEGRRDKAAEGKYSGGPIIPGFKVESTETKPSGRRIYGKYQIYLPHAEIVVKILREYVKQGGSKSKAHRALGGLVYPLFPPELEYMEQLTSLRRATRTERGYLISPAMIRLLALNLKLVGTWIWGDTEPRIGNHDAVVPVDLWLKAYEMATQSGKPRGRSINHEPLEWSGLLWFDNQGVLQKVYHHSVKEAYRSRADYVQEISQSTFNIAARNLDQPLTKAVLQKLNLTPFAEEILMQLEADTAHSGLELEERKNAINRLERRLENLEEQLGWEGGKHAQRLFKQIEKTDSDLEELKSRPVPAQSTPVINYKVVKDFLIGLPKKWYNYSRTLRNQLLGRIIDRVVLRQEERIVKATIYWKTGQSQVVEIQRARAKGNHENRWKEEEFDILKKLWAEASQETILARLPDRTWKAVAHQAYNLGLRRTPHLSNHTHRRRWEPEEEDEAKQLYEAGTPITEIASSLGRSYTAVLQRAWEKGWRRLHSDQNMAATEFSSINQNPEDSKGISSGLLFGGQVNSNVPQFKFIVVRCSYLLYCPIPQS